MSYEDDLRRHMELAKHFSPRIIDGATFYHCFKCSALVVDPESHDAYHDRRGG